MFVRSNFENSRNFLTSYIDSMFCLSAAVKLARTLSQDAKKMNRKKSKKSRKGLFGEINTSVERAFKDLQIH